MGTHGADEVQRRYQLNPSQVQFARKIEIRPIPCVVMAAKLQRNTTDGAVAFGSLHEAFECIRVNPTQIAKKDRGNHSGNTVQRHVTINFRMEVAGTYHNSPIGETQNTNSQHLLSIVISASTQLQGLVPTWYSTYCTWYMYMSCISRQRARDDLQATLGTTQNTAVCALVLHIVLGKSIGCCR